MNKTSSKRPTTYDKPCKFCGKVFEAINPNQIYCSVDCRYEHTLAESKKKTAERKNPAPPILRAKKKKKRTIDDYIAESEACGLSYGQYKAQLRLGKTFEELKAAYEEKKAGAW